uniref:Putative replication factor C subunit 5 n=2 Tax=Lygus hesperus TaxID=30085 RepID=A0A0A9YHA3_LYGHE
MDKVVDSNDGTSDTVYIIDEDAHTPWVEKYRPRTLDAVISHTNIIATLRSLLESNSLPHLLFYGPPGTGKTTSAMAIANQMYSGKLRRHMVLELNASNDRGIDVIRNQIKEFASSVQLVRDRVKLIILDEADSMTRIAQFALRRIMEKFTRTTRFIIIANYINKIIPAIQSRCTTFRFSPLHGTEIVKYLQHIADSEHLPTESAALQATTQIASGDMRRCIHILQSCFAAYHSLTLKNVYLCTGVPSPEVIQTCLDLLMNQHYSIVYGEISLLQIKHGISL